ncbi:MAG: hypothetical protein HYZ47_02980 [Simkania negevensis]|nr:hypothetical protein [Simkania negevensis]
MNKFEIEIVNYLDTEELVAEVYYSSFQWAKIFRNNKELRVQFHLHPNKEFWEFPFKEALQILEQAKNKLLKKLGTKSSPVSEEQIDPKKINEQAQEILEKIISHPERMVIYGELSRFGKVMDIYAPGLGGVRYTIDEEFIGFLEP